MVSLIQLCHEGKINAVMSSIDTTKDINQLDTNGSNALHIASMANHVWIVRFLLDSGCVKIDTLTRSGFTALSVACMHGSIRVVRYLISVGADIHCSENNCATALHCACCYNQYDIVQVLLSAGADVNIRNEYEQTPLFDACTHGLDIVKCLVNVGADIRVRDFQGMTALHYACRFAHSNTVAFLRASGADLSTCCNAGWSALHQASSNRYQKNCTRRFNMVKWLLNHGVQVNMKTNMGTTALHQICCCSTEQLALVRLMIKAGADVQATDKMGRSILSRAVRHKHQFITYLLLQHGALQNDEHWFPALNGSPVWTNIIANLRNLQWFASGFLTAAWHSHKGIGSLYGNHGCMATIAEYCTGTNLEMLRAALAIHISKNNFMTATDDSAVQVSSEELSLLC